MKGYDENWGLPFIGLGKWDLLHWDWDSNTGENKLKWDFYSSTVSNSII